MRVPPLKGSIRSASGFIAVVGLVVTLAGAIDGLAGPIRCGHIDTAADHPVSVFVVRMTIDAPHILATLRSAGHMHVVLEIGILQGVFDITAFEVRPATRGRVAAQAHGPVGQ